jgi:hypothetical protein
MSVIPQLIYTFNIIPIKIPASCYVEIGQLILSLIETQDME